MFLDNSLSCSTQRGYYFEKIVQDFPDLYGRENVSYNIHNMLHVENCFKEYGGLMNISAYKFENYLKIIKRSVKMPRYIGQQIYNKFLQKNCIAIKNGRFNFKKYFLRKLGNRNR